jgi:hypothetical protein
MGTYTNNHGLYKPADNEHDWGDDYRTDFDTIDTALTVRDTDANKTNYSALSGARYEATDTGAVYLGDGSTWVFYRHQPTDHIADDYADDSSGRYTEQSGTWTFNTGSSRVESADTAGTQRLILSDFEFGSALYECDVELPSAATNTTTAQIGFGWQDSSNYYVVEVDSAADEVRVDVVDAGSTTALASASQTVSLDTTYTVTVDWAPDTDTIDVYIDDSDMSGSPAVNASNGAHSAGKPFVGADDAQVYVSRLDIGGHLVRRYL